MNDLTLEEAIAHAEEVADYDCYNDEQMKCADEHRQLAEWLKELKRLKEAATDTDTISRQEAIDAVNNLTYPSSLVDVKRELVELPSAQPKTGKWIKATGMMPPEFHGHHCCSECGRFANMEPPFGNREDLSKFCPRCGARMVREDSE